MKRVPLFAVFFAVLFLLSMHRALALYEFCPTDIRTAAVSPKADGSATVYGFQLTALGPRSVSATIAFDTDAGWFTAQVPSTTLAQKERHYTGQFSDFTMRDWISPIMYLQFAQPVKLRQQWVLHALATGDQFGWAAQGDVLCEPYSGGAGEYLPVAPSFGFTTKDIDPISQAPASGSTIIKAQTSVALKKSDCPDPFENTIVTSIAKPNNLTPARTPQVTAVAVAIKDDGTVADAWIWGPSGDNSSDQAALTAAKNSTFKAGRAYCQASPGFYYLTVRYGLR